MATRKVDLRLFKTAKVFVGANRRTLLVYSRERTVLEVYLMFGKYTLKTFLRRLAFPKVCFFLCVK